MGWRRAVRAQRFRTRSRGVDAGAFRRPCGDASYRLGHDHHSRRRVRLGRAVAPIRQAPLCRPVHARDPLRRRRVCCFAGRCREVGQGRAHTRQGRRFRRALPAARPGTGARRDILFRRDGEIAAENRGQRRRVVLSRRAGRSDGRACPRAWRRPHACRFRCASLRLGNAARARLPRPYDPRDPAQWPGHRGADGARHPRELRSRCASGRRGRDAASGDRGDEARVRRCLPLRRRPGDDASDTCPAARSRLSFVAGASDRPRSRAGLRPRHAAARRHRLSRRRGRKRHDGVADPVELHGLRLGDRRTGHRHQHAESRHRLFAASRTIRTWSAAASVRSTRSFPASPRAMARRTRRSA